MRHNASMRCDRRRRPPDPCCDALINRKGWSYPKAPKVRALAGKTVVGGHGAWAGEATRRPARWHFEPLNIAFVPLDHWNLLDFWDAETNSLIFPHPSLFFWDCIPNPKASTPLLDSRSLLLRSSNRHRSNHARPHSGHGALRAGAADGAQPRQLRQSPPRVLRHHRWRLLRPRHSPRAGPPAGRLRGGPAHRSGCRSRSGKRLDSGRWGYIGKGMQTLARSIPHMFYSLTGLLHTCT